MLIVSGESIHGAYTLPNDRSGRLGATDYEYHSISGECDYLYNVCNEDLVLENLQRVYLPALFLSPHATVDEWRGYFRSLPYDQRVDHSRNATNAVFALNAAKRQFVPYEPIGRDERICSHVKAQGIAFVAGLSPRSDTWGQPFGSKWARGSSFRYRLDERGNEIRDAEPTDTLYTLESFIEWLNDVGEDTYDRTLWRDVTGNHSASPYIPVKCRILRLNYENTDRWLRIEYEIVSRYDYAGHVFDSYKECSIELRYGNYMWNRGLNALSITPGSLSFSGKIWHTDLISPDQWTIACRPHSGEWAKFSVKLNLYESTRTTKLSNSARRKAVKKIKDDFDDYAQRAIKVARTTGNIKYQLLCACAEEFSPLANLQLIEGAAELGELIWDAGGVFSYIENIRDVLADIQKKKRVSFYKAVLIALDALASGVLLWNFALKPTVKDVQTLAQEVLSKYYDLNIFDTWRTFRQKASYDVVDVPGLGRVSTVVRVLLRARIPEESIIRLTYPLRALGLSPSLDQWWNLVPLSFVANWFISDRVTGGVELAGNSIHVLTSDVAYHVNSVKLYIHAVPGYPNIDVTVYERDVSMYIPQPSYISVLEGNQSLLKFDPPFIIGGSLAWVFVR